MRKILNINADWLFFYKNEGEGERLNLPHTWNGIDGQDGGGDYLRCVSRYEKTFSKPEFGENDVLQKDYTGLWIGLGVGIPAVLAGVAITVAVVLKKKRSKQ